MVGAGTPIGTEEVEGYLWRVKWVDYTDIALVMAVACEFQGDRNPIIWDLKSGYKLHHIVPVVLKFVEKKYGSVENYIEKLKVSKIEESDLFMNMEWVYPL